MAVVPTGSILSFGFDAGTSPLGNANTGTASSTITVPADADLVCVGVSNYQGTAGGDAAMTFTKGGVDAAMGKCTGTADGTSFWNGALFWLELPDTGANKTLKWDWVGTGASSDAVTLINVAFFKGCDTTGAVRSSGGVQANATPFNTGTLTAQSGDLIIAFCSLFNSVQDGSGTITGWNNLTTLAQSPGFLAYADGAWATGSPSGNTTVGVNTWSATSPEGGLCAIVVKAATAASFVPYNPWPQAAPILAT